MNEKDLIDSLREVDAVLGECINPALKRSQHDAIRNVMQMGMARVQLSYKLEKEKKDKIREEIDKNDEVIDSNLVTDK